MLNLFSSEINDPHFQSASKFCDDCLTSLCGSQKANLVDTLTARLHAANIFVFTDVTSLIVTRLSLTLTVRTNLGPFTITFTKIADRITVRMLQGTKQFGDSFTVFLTESSGDEIRDGVEHPEGELDEHGKG